MTIPEEEVEAAVKAFFKAPHPSWWAGKNVIVGIRAALLAAAKVRGARERDEMLESEIHGLDTTERVCFYEQDFYVLSNFSSFRVQWGGRFFPTSEHAYHYAKFTNDPVLRESIHDARSAHEAFKMAERSKNLRRADWDSVKVEIMRDILRAKVRQHEYVYRKLLATGDRELVENSWRDDFWGWGANRNGKNMLGKLWMEIRAEIRALKETGN